MKEVEQALEILREGFAIAFTGAGVSTASGIPDYRGKNGLWKGFDPKDLSLESFLGDPEKYWAMRMHMKKAGFDILNAEPKPAHYAIAELERMGIIREIVTQNTDGLHQKANPSSRVIELQGNWNLCVCTKCGRKFPAKEAEGSYEETSIAPRCPDCYVVLRPEVVLFGEGVSSLNLELAVKAATNCRSVLVLGTTASVYPASLIPKMARMTGAKLLEINEERTDLTDRIADLTIHGDCSKILPSLVSHLKGANAS